MKTPFLYLGLRFPAILILTIGTYKECSAHQVSAYLFADNQPTDQIKNHNLEITKIEDNYLRKFS